jgi:hypothetical protein
MVTLDRLDGFSPQSRKTSIKKNKTTSDNFLQVGLNDDVKLNDKTLNSDRIVKVVHTNF